MTQKQRDRKTCRVCGAHRDDVGPMSNSGICVECCERRMIQNHVDLRTRSGTYWKVWQRGMARAGGLVRVDEPGEEA